MSVCVSEEGTIRTIGSENFGLDGIDYLLHESFIPYSSHTFDVTINTPIPILNYRIILFFFNYGPTNATMNQTLYTIIGDMHPKTLEIEGSSNTSVTITMKSYGSSQAFTYRRLNDYSFSLAANTTEIRSVTVMGIR